MDLRAHFFNVGCGNMTLLILPDGSSLMYDCNITDANKDRILRLADDLLGPHGHINLFISSHPHRDHIRGIQILDDEHRIDNLWYMSSPVEADTPEYQEYLRVLRRSDCLRVLPGMRQRIQDVELDVINAKFGDRPGLDEYSIVVHVIYGDASIMLTGDTNAKRWKEWIVPRDKDMLRTTVLLASQHGSLDFFEDPSGGDKYYREHLDAMTPEITIVSVGPNMRKLPSDKALQLYAQRKGDEWFEQPVLTTEEYGTISISLTSRGTWTLKTELQQSNAIAIHG